MAFKWYEKYYDKFIDKICPDYSKSLEILVNSIPHGTKKIKELGCGTGNLTEIIAKRFPDTKIIAYDSDKNQLNMARKKLNKYNVNLIEKEILDIGYTKDDIIISSLVFHLLPKKKRYALFQKLYDAKVNSIHIFDRLKGETPEEEKKYQRYFKNNLINNKLPEDLINDLVDENKTNNPNKLSEQREFFSQRGYSLETLFRNPSHGFMVYKVDRNIQTIYKL